MNYDFLFDQLDAGGFTTWVNQLRLQQRDWLIRHGDYARWNRSLTELPVIENARGKLDQSAVTVEGHCAEPEKLKNVLQGLSPWRKGPYQIADIFIDSEWRSDYKWSRVLPHLSSLTGGRVLDIGCGNGFHCWRMLAENPRLVVGVEPSVLFNLQFRALQHYLNRKEACMLPFGIEALPDDMSWFDTVFSMGVLYHRKSPIDHLIKLKSLLIPGGELCLETLVIEGSEGELLLPADRYARMRNVWFIPSAKELASWLRRCGFESVQIISESITTTDEQRSTEWMKFESLKECLDSNCINFTVEGLPAPRRAILLANKPA
ncbi:MAG: tRNA 5-methoxyuridine(34)/uridine 5-oxyacetic acid(34) synthase CmoB [Gammaproteobacteria bacterium]|nr:tRNA 5-methoxyuridine(34)/uridine 5-oxyacetic acid(34) synthase CmoB [Gammaproteobacteria bacterium]